MKIKCLVSLLFFGSALSAVAGPSTNPIKPCFDLAKRPLTVTNVQVPTFVCFGRYSVTFAPFSAILNLKNVESDASPVLTEARLVPVARDAEGISASALLIATHGEGSEATLRETVEVWADVKLDSHGNLVSPLKLRGAIMVSRDHAANTYGSLEYVSTNDRALAMAAKSCNWVRSDELLKGVGCRGDEDHTKPVCDAGRNGVFWGRDGMDRMCATTQAVPGGVDPGNAFLQAFEQCVCK